MASPPAPAAARSPSTWRSRSRSAVERRLLLLGGRQLLDLLDLEAPAGRGRGRARRRGRAGRRARGRARGRARARPTCASRSSGLAGPAEAVEQLELAPTPTVSLRCSCWPKKATSRPPSSRRSAAVAERPPDVGARAALGADPAGQHDLAVGAVEALAQVGQLGVVEQPGGQLEDALDVGLGARPAARCPARGLPPSSRSSAWASTVLPAPVSPVTAFSPAPGRSSARSMSSRFSMRSSRSTRICLATAADGAGRAAFSQ